MGKGGSDDAVNQHFGRAPAYTVFDTDTGEYSVVVRNGSEGPADLMAGAGVNVMLCGGIGKGASAMLQQRGIDVFIGASGTIKDAIDAWNSGALSKNPNGNCNSHEHDDNHDECSSNCNCHSHVTIS
jgi:predicted Fe-Mo cluster-binding NifX family protein